MVRRTVVLAVTLVAVAASVALYRTRRRRARKLSQSSANERWEGEGGAILPGDIGYDRV